MVLLRVCELFTSLQGEGLSLGEPASFLRLSGCNLRCGWCDTPYSWDFARFPKVDEQRALDIEEVAATLEAWGPRRLVITGGEPLLQRAGLVELVARLGREWTIEVETNGTVVPEAALRDRVEQWNVSLKLAGSGEARDRRIRPAAIEALRVTGNAWWKWVVSTPQDADEARRLAAEFHLPAARQLYMPEARTAEEHAERATAVAMLALEHGVRFSPRLQVLLWSAERGR